MAILLVKSVIWIIALASGTSGGVLAPLLIFGGCAGWLEGQWLPGDHGAWALIGMAAMMGGTMRSPLTAILFAVELTGDFALLGPLLVATSAAYALTVLLLKRSILTEKIARRGQHVVREYSIDPFELMRVSEVMVREVDTLPAAMPVDEAIAFFSSEARRHKSYPLIDAGGQVAGMVARADVLRWRAESPHGEETLFDRISDRSLDVGHPDEPVSHLADRMVLADVGRVPIVERDTQRLVGLVSRKDLLAYPCHGQIDGSQPCRLLWPAGIARGRAIPLPFRQSIKPVWRRKRTPRESGCFTESAVTLAAKINPTQAGRNPSRSFETARSSRFRCRARRCA